MIPSYLLPLFNHLWQSTLVAVAAAGLVFVLRSNCAHARYWLWLIASVKFLIPFSLLIAIGSRLEWPKAAPAIASHRFSMFVEQFSQPFAPAPSLSLPAPASIPAPTDFLPGLLLAVWLFGLAAVLLRWHSNWRRIRAVMRAGSPLSLDVNVPVLSTPALLEPGIFGIWRPVLLLPEGITEHLAPAQLRAILAHELCHLRRRDNLAAAVHMIVEALFWFHPLVWWLGARLVEERERACDEEVLNAGSEPAIYAESILKVCQFYLGSPLACMSGVTGSDLKQRVIRIMTHRAAYKLDLGRKLLLTAIGMATVIGPVAFGLANAPPGQTQTEAPSQPSNGERLTFEVASIKPAKPGAMGSRIGNQPGGRFTATNVSLKMLMTIAYNIQPFQLTGAPSWLESDQYDIAAKADIAPEGDSDRSLLGDKKQMDDQRLRLRSLLADRCKLTFHHETKELPVYALVLAKSAPKLRESAVQTTGKPDRHMMMGMGHLTGAGVPLSFLAETLSRQLGRVVLDRTGLTGSYDFELKWTPDSSQMMGLGPGEGWRSGPPMGPGSPKEPPPPDPNGPTIFTAIQEQLGLKLETQKGPVDIVVIDHIEKPSEN